MSRIVIMLSGIVLAGYALSHTESRSKASSEVYSDIKDDEHVTFFRTSAWLNRADQTWHIPIHGWIYEPQNSLVRKAIFAEALEQTYGLRADQKTEANFTERVNLMLADNERGKQMVIDLGGQKYALPRSKPNGHFQTTLKVPATEISRIAHSSFIEYSAVTRDGEQRVFSGQVLLLPPEGISIISDIDDTIKISEVADRQKLFNHTFFLDFKAVPGMARLYKRWSENGASVHFVSSSPWQLYSPLREFTDFNDFPWATFSLKSVRFRDKTLLNPFKKGTETKPPQIEAILNAYHERKFILVGDSGEQDPEVYAGLIRKHPDQIVKVFVRNVTQESSNNERFQSVFDGIAQDRWQLFEDPATLEIPDIGI